jgi:hypothetical protein
MSEYYRKLGVNIYTLDRLIIGLHKQEKPVLGPRKEAEVWIEDALAKRVVAKAGKALEKKIERGEI